MLLNGCEVLSVHLSDHNRLHKQYAKLSLLKTQQNIYILRHIFINRSYTTDVFFAQSQRGLFILKWSEA